MAELTTREIAVMHHAVGWPKCYRNHFAADDGSLYGRTCASLVGRGLMVRGRTIPGGLIYYHVSEAGQAILETMRRDERPEVGR